LRIVLSLVLLITVFALFVTNGCGNADIPIREVITMAESVNPVPGSNMTGGYKTATFALG